MAGEEGRSDTANTVMTTQPTMSTGRSCHQPDVLARVAPDRRHHLEVGSRTEP